MRADALVRLRDGKEADKRDVVVVVVVVTVSRSLITNKHTMQKHITPSDCGDIDCMIRETVNDDGVR